MKFIINLALGLFSFMAAGRRSKHAALSRIGRSRSSWFYAGRHYISAAGGVGDIMPASRLVWQLKAERIRALRYA